MTGKSKEIGQEEMKELLREFEENPFDSQSKSPADVMRIFFQFNTTILPVISKRNMLLGIITKDAITREMSDIARFSGIAIDKFITRISVKMSFDELLPYVANQREFTVINLFGEVMGSWPRIQLIAACDNISLARTDVDSEIELQREEQQIQWMVYHVLEHIPRGLYAVNEKGRTVFYNSFFEDMYLMKTGKDEVDAVHAEMIFADKSKNDFSRSPDGNDLLFHNSDLDVSYEKIPMNDSSGKINGYLYYFGKSSDDASQITVSPNGTLITILEDVERQIIVKSLGKNKGDVIAASSELSVPKNTLISKINKYHIDVTE